MESVKPEKVGNNFTQTKGETRWQLVLAEEAGRKTVAVVVEEFPAVSVVEGTTAVVIKAALGMDKVEVEAEVRGGKVNRRFLKSQGLA